jgi:hypothetical protein
LRARSVTKTSVRLLLSSVTRSEAAEAYATMFPSPEMAGDSVTAGPSAGPLAGALSRVVVPGVVDRSRPNTSAPAPGPPALASTPPTAKATSLPSPETANSSLGRMNWAPAGSRLTRSLTIGDGPSGRK